MNVQGNSTNIVSGDTTPTTTDNTDFGSTPVNMPVSQTFTIANTGDGALNLTGSPKVSVTGGYFSVMTQPTSPVAALTGTTNFVIQFLPMGSGVSNGTVSIANDDSLHNPYTFSITGTGGNALNQTISFNAPTTGTYEGTATLSATATSGLTVSFSSATPSICTVNGTTVNYIAVGTCTINADQPGDTNYNAAPQFSGNILVNPTTPTTPISPPSSSGGSDNVISVVATVPLNNGVVDGSMSNYNQTTTNLTIPENSSVSGGVLAGDTMNNGLAANVTIAPNSTVTGGKLSGFNTNLGTLQDVTVSQYSQVQGGNYAGTIYNNGTLINPILSPNSSAINNGVLENPVILPDANVTGGKLTGTIIALGTYDTVEIPPSAKIITRVADIPPPIFQQFNAQTLTQLPASVISQITPEQFAQIPVTALSGLTAENMGAISPQVTQTLDKEQIQELNTEEFKAMPTEEVAKLLTNFDVEQITPQEAEKLLPKGWAIDSQGNLTAPPNSKIALKSLNISDLPSGLTLPEMTDLNSSFALGGKGNNSILPQINKLGDAAGFIASQQAMGVVHASVAGAVGGGGRNKFAFMIDPKHLFILTEDALRGLQMNEQGQYILVTDDGKEIPITPMTQDPEGLLSILSENATIDIRPTGEVLIKHIPIKRTRDGEEVHSIGMFDPFVEPAPEDICTPEGICNWDQADASMQPGMRSSRNVRAKAAAKIIYPDGSSQKLYPAVLSPEILVEEAKQFEGVEKAIFRMDGTFAVTYQGTKLLLIPEFDTQVQPIPVGQKVEPSLTLQPDGTLLYQVPHLDQLFSTSLKIAES
jgi:ribosomal protein S16